MAVIGEDGLIKEVAGQDQLPETAADQVSVTYSEGCLVPSFIDSHVHLRYGTGQRMAGPRSYHQVAEVFGVWHSGARVCAGTL